METTHLLGADRSHFPRRADHNWCPYHTDRLVDSHAPIACVYPKADQDKRQLTALGAGSSPLPSGSVPRMCCRCPLGCRACWRRHTPPCRHHHCSCLLQHSQSHSALTAGRTARLPAKQPGQITQGHTHKLAPGCVVSTQGS